MDLILEEIKLTEEIIDINEILSFQTDHDIQIIRGEDYNYMCYIDKEVYSIQLTPMFALVTGIKNYKDE